MKHIFASILLLSSTVAAYANGTSHPPLDVPEISVLAGFAAIGVVGAVAALVWERRRK